MSKIRFNLHRHKNAGHYIRLVFRYDGQKLVYYPGTEIQEADWNAKAQRVRPTAPNHRQINQRLKTIADKVEAIYLEHHAAGLPLSPARFRQLLDEFWKGRTLPAAGQVELLHFLQQLTEERKARNLRRHHCGDLLPEHIEQRVGVEGQRDLHFVAVCAHRLIHFCPFLVPFFQRPPLGSPKAVQNGKEPTGDYAEGDGKGVCEDVKHFSIFR